MVRLLRNIVVLSATWAAAVSATPLTGEVRVLDPTGANIIAPTLTITGNLDAASNAMSVDPFPFFGATWSMHSIELLVAGTYTRPDGVGGNISVTVNPGQLGAYIVFDWSVNTMPNFMVWDVNSNPGGASYTTADSDGDGVPGQAFVVGPFPGFSVAYDFTVGEPPPDVAVSIDVDGGAVQECAETGGSLVTLTAVTDLTGGAILGSVEWFVDGASVGAGVLVTPFMALGAHTVEALASTTTGETSTASIGIEVRDTTPPVLAVGFFDRRGNPISITQAGRRVTTHIAATDICDPEPVTEGTVVPVFAVSDGDTITISGGKVNTLKLPATAIDLSATARDVSGNSATGMAVLSIIDK